MSDYIPPEVVTEVLSRLPVKYLLRSRCVCKEWNSIISSPSFTSKQLSHSSSSSPHTLVRHYSKLHSKEIYTLYNDDGFTSEYTRIDFPFNEKCRHYFRIVGYCNGLLCLSDDLFGCKETIILWNPSIKRAVTLPPPRLNYDLVRHDMFALGFGYDSERNDYKVVRLAYLLTDKNKLPLLPPKVEVFSLSTGVWRLIKNDVGSYITSNLWAQGFIHGSVHWVAFKKTITNMNKYGRPYLNLVLKFDLTSESFVELGLPDDLASLPPVNLHASTIKGFLSIINNHTLFTEFTRDYSGICSIWVMLDYGNVDSWTKIFNISLEPGLWMMFVFKSDGDTLFSGRSGELVSYHSENMAVTCTGIYGTKYSFFVDKYVESLVLLGKGKEVQGPEPAPDCEDEDETVEESELLNKMGAYMSVTWMAMEPDA